MKISLGSVCTNMVGEKCDEGLFGAYAWMKFTGERVVFDESFQLMEGRRNGRLPASA